MSKKESPKQLESELNSLLKSHQNVLNCNLLHEQNIIENHLNRKTYLTSFSCSFFDLYKSRFTFHRSVYNQLLARPALSTDIHENIHLPLKITHPDDIVPTLETEILIYKYFMQLHPDNYNTAEVIFSRRFRENNDEYRTYIHHLCIDRLDEKGLPWILKIETKRLEQCILPFFRIFTPMYANYTEKHDFSGHLYSIRLRKRELEVLSCVIMKNTIKDIAKELNISPNTVNTYYKLINKKMQVNSIYEARELAIILGLIK